jgi:hypothetical protein
MPEPQPLLHRLHLFIELADARAVLTQGSWHGSALKLLLARAGVTGPL